MQASTMDARLGADRYRAMEASTRFERVASAIKARVRTRSVGFRMGGFGLTLTERDVSMEPEGSAARQSVRRFRDTVRDNAFADQWGVEQLREALMDAAPSASSTATSPASDSLPPNAATRALGLAAYGRGASSETPLPGDMLAAVI